MASKNNLLNGINLVEEVAVEAPKFAGWLYRNDCLEGKLIKGEDEYKRLKAQGWVQSIREARGITVPVVEVKEDIPFDIDEVKEPETAKIEDMPIEVKAVVLEAEIKKKQRGRPARKN